MTTLTRPRRDDTDEFDVEELIELFNPSPQGRHDTSQEARQAYIL